MRLFLLTLIVLLFSAGARAGLFKYKDEDGNLHVVDSENAVPEKYRKVAKSASTPPSAASEEELGPCNGKKMCGMIVVATHCPVCLNLLPTYRTYLQNNSAQKEEGLVAVVVHTLLPEQNKEFARGLGDKGVVLDTDGARARKLGVNSYPRYLVLDAYRNTVLRDNEAHGWIQKKFGTLKPVGAIPQTGVEFLPPPAPPAQPVVSPPAK